MPFGLEIFNNILEFIGKIFHVFKIVLSKGLELLYSGEYFYEFGDSSAEKIKLSEDLCFCEIKRSVATASLHVCDFIFGLLVAIFVSLVESNATFQDRDELGRLSIPDVIGLLAIEDSVLAIGDHLVGDFHKETSHFVSRVVESGNGVYHLNSIHEGRQSLDDLFRSPVIQRLYELLQSGQIFEVVLRLIQLVCQLQVQPIVIIH